MSIIKKMDLLSICAEEMPAAVQVSSNLIQKVQFFDESIRILIWN